MRLEKNPKHMVGGRVNEQIIAGIRFELGPSLMLLPDVYRRTFQDLGLDLDKEILVKRVAPTYKAYFEDGTNLVLDPRDPGFRQALEDLEGGWPNFIEEEITPNVLPKFLRNALTLKNWPL